MRRIEVLSIQRVSPTDFARIAAVDPAVHVADAGGWFDGEIRDTWPPFSSARYLAPGANGKGTREERDALLARAEVILGGWPYPLDLRSRAPNLKWFHQRPAGASNLLMGDLWGSDVTVTTSRGAGNTLAIAEYAIAGILHFTRGFHVAHDGTFDHRAYRSLSIGGKTLCVIGAGGIGQDVGRLGAGLGMRVVGTRRSYRPGDALPAGFTAIGGADALDGFLTESDFVVVACQWTPETTGLIGTERLALMKPGTILVNVARGEIVDEDAVADALERGHLRGVVMDVYNGEFEHLPPERLWKDKRVLITPHISGNSDANQHGAIEVFCDNLAAYIAGRPLRNVIDWSVGY
jgi:phosphoglycerate dehydrogenase-like enzyme